MAHAVEVIVHAVSGQRPVSERYFGRGDTGHHFVELLDEFDLLAANEPIAYLNNVVGRVISVFVETGGKLGNRTYALKTLLCLSDEPLVAFKDEVEANAVADEIKTYARFLREA